MKNWIPYSYQKFAVKHGIKFLNSGLFLEMGLGKTVVALTIIKELLSWMEISKVIVIAPKAVAESTWPEELSTWKHLKGITMSVISGSARNRLKAMHKKADIYVISRDNVVWLCKILGDRWPFELTIIDELSSFKSTKAQRFIALKSRRPLMKRVIGLTGTPAPNSLLDLWPQMFLIDQGERLGKTVTYYRDTFFSMNRQENYATFKLIEGADKKIFDSISDICISMKSEDYLDLPPWVSNNRMLTFDSALMDKYKEFEKEQILKLLEGNEITVFNAAALSNKLTQFASGAVYDEFKEAHIMHSYKLDALEEIIEEMAGNSLLVFYWFKSSKERLLKRFKKYKPVILNNVEARKDWNKKKITLGLLHPASGGHGINLQLGGSHSVWFDHTWSAELCQQANKRIHRPGQIHTVINTNIVIKGTMDEIILERLENKEAGQNSLMKAIAAKVKEHGFSIKKKNDKFVVWQ